MTKPIIALAATFVLSACATHSAPPTATQSPPPASSQPTRTIELSLMEIQQVTTQVTTSPSLSSSSDAGPATVAVTVLGTLNTACASFHSSQQARDGDTITLALWAAQPTEVLCARRQHAYQRTLPLDGTFEAGQYRLIVNDFETTFRVSGPDKSTAPVAGLAFVTSVDVIVNASNLPHMTEVTVEVRGFLPDGCTQLTDTVQTREGNTIQVTMHTLRSAETLCTQATIQFQESVVLDGNFAAGDYIVAVNEVETRFHVK